MSDMANLIFNISDKKSGVNHCLYCGSRDPCRVDRDTGFCNLYPLGDQAPCVTGKPIGCDDDMVEQMARAMAISNSGWVGEGDHWRAYEAEARRWLAAFRVYSAFA